MLKCIIIEDQAPAQYILKKYIGNTDILKLEKTFPDALEAGIYLEQNPIDLVFLDINLPRISGIDFLKTKANHPLTILTTAYSEFALECYQYHVVDYLLKPFSYDRFSQAIDKVIAMTRSLQQLGNATNTAANRYVTIKSSHDLVRILEDDIILIKSDSDYTEVVTTQNKYLTSDSLKEWTVKLSGVFSQVHKSYIVNTNRLNKVSHNRIHLVNSHVVPIGRVFKKNFMEKFARQAI